MTVYSSSGVRRVVIALALAGLSCVAVLPGHSAADSASEAAGAKLFTETGCPQCHGPLGMGTAKGPSLRDLRKHRKADAMRKQIHDGGANMPPFGDALTDDEIGTLVNFLQAKNGWKLVVPAPVTAQ